MNAPSRILRVVSESEPLANLISAVLVEVRDDGLLLVEIPGRGACVCAWLEGAQAPHLGAGDSLLVVHPVGSAVPVALGRIGTYSSPRAETNLTLEAAESLTLKCGEAQINLRADGKVMVKGDDVLIRAKGTQRIRAGTVAIN